MDKNHFSTSAKYCSEKTWVWFKYMFWFWWTVYAFEWRDMRNINTKQVFFLSDRLYQLLPVLCLQLEDIFLTCALTLTQKHTRATYKPHHETQVGWLPWLLGLKCHRCPGAEGSGVAGHMMRSCGTGDLSLLGKDAIQDQFAAAFLSPLSIFNQEYGWRLSLLHLFLHTHSSNIQIVHLKHVHQ